MAERPPLGMDNHPDGGHVVYCEVCNYQGERHADFLFALNEYTEHGKSAKHLKSQKSHGDKIKPKPDERVPLADTVQWLVDYDVKLLAHQNPPTYHAKCLAQVKCMEQIYKIEHQPYGTITVTATTAQNTTLAHGQPNEFKDYAQALEGLNNIIANSLPFPDRDWILNHYHVA